MGLMMTVIWGPAEHHVSSGETKRNIELSKWFDWYNIDNMRLYIKKNIIEVNIIAPQELCGIYNENNTEERERERVKERETADDRERVSVQG